MFELPEVSYPIGRCYWLGLCDWWNPPEDMKGDFCIKCWKWKDKQENTTVNQNKRK